MDRPYDYYQSYSWHQSHDQATILLLVPYETVEDDVVVIIERNYLVAGVRGQSPIVKGRLYGNVDVLNSMWQLEPRASHLSARERTTSTVSTASTQSSFAFVSDPEISSSFAASIEGGLGSEFDYPDSASPALSSPVALSADDHPLPQTHRRANRFTFSHPVSPRTGNVPLSMASSYSSLDSLHTGSDRLLTLHLEKAESVIWPSLVVGPVPESLSPCNTVLYPWGLAVSSNIELKYNMDPTSLVLIALDLCDIRNSKEEAFEYFVRAWHLAHVPSATVRLSTHYLPANATFPDLNIDTTPSPSSSTFTLLQSSPAITPTSLHPPPILASDLDNIAPPAPVPVPGTPAYYLMHLGGPQALAQLYLEAGLLHLEGTAASLLSSSYTGLSSLRTSSTTSCPSPSYAHDLSSSTSGSAAEAWRRDREIAQRHFERARALDPGLDIPLLPPTRTDAGCGVTGWGEGESARVECGLGFWVGRGG